MLSHNMHTVLLQVQRGMPYDSTIGVPFWMGYVVLLFVAYVAFRVWLKLRHARRNPLTQKGRRKKCTPEQLAKEEILAGLKETGVSRFPSLTGRK